MPNTSPRSVAEIDSFISLLCVACDDSDVYDQLEKILTLPNEHRKLVINALISDMRKANAPQDFMAAIACLVDTEVAEKAYEVIFKCQRGILF